MSMNGVLENIYNTSPIWFQNIMASGAGYRNSFDRFGKDYYEYREFLIKFDKLSLDEKLEYQNKEMIDFLHFTVNNSSFYKTLYRGINIESIKTVDDLKILPVVDKEMLRNNIDDVMTVSAHEAVEGHTGGTTGKSLVVRFTRPDFMKRMAMLDHFKARFGFEHLKMKRASFTGKPIIPTGQKKKVYWRYNKYCKQMLYSSFYLTEENMPYFVQSLNDFKPDSIDGFPSSIFDVANYLYRNNIRLQFVPIAVFPTSETLTKPSRDLIQSVFKCPVYDQYASSEGAPFVTECKNHILHIELSSGIFENISNDDNEILITSFTTHGTPLIRYKIGDCMDFDYSGNCSCGLDMPIVKNIVGRQMDFIYTAEKAKINAGNLSNVFKNIPNAIIKAQFVQNKIGEVTIFIIPDRKLFKKEYEFVIRNEFNNKFGLSTKVQIVYVDNIPLTSRGKSRFIINNVKI